MLNNISSCFSGFTSFYLITLILFPVVGISQSDTTLFIENFDYSETLNSWHPNQTSTKTSYKIQEDSTGTFLSVASAKDDNFLIKEINVDIAKYPYLNWRWRAKVLPKGGNELNKSTCDIAASIYIILRASKWRPQSIKYTWSTSLDVGTQGSSPFAIWPSRSDFIVVESGYDKLGQWVNHKINVLEAYKSLYHKTTVDSKLIKALALMTDSDNTESSSAADYDDIYFSKK